MTLCIADQDREKALEEYQFDFEYDDNNVTSLNMRSSPQGDCTRVSADANPRAAGVTMIRVLVQLMNTLGPVPEFSSILMRLTYTDQTVRYSR